jgi:hypothetical protein
MALREREYFYLDEVLAKLQMSRRDVQYWISHCNLSVAAWVPETIFLQKSEDGPSPVCHHGFLTLDPEASFVLFNHGQVMARRFYTSYPDRRFDLPEFHPGILITEGSLVVFRTALDAFISAFCIEPPDQKKAAGRPRLIDPYIEEHKSRVHRGIAKRTASAESSELHRLGCHALASPFILPALPRPCKVGVDSESHRFNDHKDAPWIFFISRLSRIS